MHIKSTLYRFAFTLARAAVIGAEQTRWQPPTTISGKKGQYDHAMHRDDDQRPALSGVGGGGHRATPLRSSRRDG
jgi:hypothetical protein